MGGQPVVTEAVSADVSHSLTDSHTGTFFSLLSSVTVWDHHPQPRQYADAAVSRASSKTGLGCTPAKGHSPPVSPQRGHRRPGGQ